MSVSLNWLSIWQTKHEIASTRRLHRCWNLIRPESLAEDCILTRFRFSLFNISCYLIDRGRKHNTLIFIVKWVTKMVIEHKIKVFFRPANESLMLCVDKVKFLTGRQSVFIEFKKKKNAQNTCRIYTRKLIIPFQHQWMWWWMIRKEIKGGWWRL